MKSLTFLFMVNKSWWESRQLSSKCVIRNFTMILLAYTTVETVTSRHIKVNWLFEQTYNPCNEKLLLLHIIRILKYYDSCFYVMKNFIICHQLIHTHKNPKRMYTSRISIRIIAFRNFCLLGNHDFDILSTNLLSYG